MAKVNETIQFLIPREAPVMTLQRLKLLLRDKGWTPLDADLDGNPITLVFEHPHDAREGDFQFFGIKELLGFTALRGEFASVRPVKNPEYLIGNHKLVYDA